MTDEPERSQVCTESPPEGRRNHGPDPHHDGGQDQPLTDTEQGHRQGHNPAAGGLGYSGKRQRPQGNADSNN